MKAKSFVVVLSLSMLIPTQSLTGTGGGPDRKIPAEVFTVPAGAAIGYLAGWTLEYCGAEKVASMRYVQHLLDYATPRQKTVLNSHLKELGALVGALIATGNTKNIALLFEVNFVIDMVQRIKKGNFSTDSIIRLAIDTAAIYAIEGKFKTSPVLKEA